MNFLYLVWMKSYEVINLISTLKIEVWLIYSIKFHVYNSDSQYLKIILHL